MTQEGFVTATRCATEDEARAVAVRLVEHGIGATVERLPEPPTADVAATQDSAGASSWPVDRPAEVPVAAAGEVVGDDPRPFAVRVLAGDERRAGEILAAEAADGPGGAGGGTGSGTVAAAGTIDDHDHRLLDDHDVEAIEKPPTPWKKILLIWAAAMIIIPLAAFVLTYLILSR